MHLIREDFKKAYKVFEYTCHEYKHGKACNNLGVFTYQGKGIKKPDIKKSVEHFKTGCENGSGEACYHYGQMVSGRDKAMVDKGIKVDMKKSIEALEKGCELGCPDACFDASAAYLFGEIGYQKDEGKAFTYAKKACEEYFHFDSCNNLLIMHQKGLGTKKDPEAAKVVQAKIDDYVDQLQKKRNLDMGRTE